MIDKTNVLIFPAGEVISVELHDALSTSVNINLFGASSVDRHGPYIFSNYVSGLPLITEDDFIEKFNQLIDGKSIDLIFPTHDDVVLFLADNAEKIKAKVIGPDQETAQIARDKALIHLTFEGADFMPRIFERIDEYPRFIKPRTSQGGVGAKLIKRKEDIPLDIDLTKYVICEYLPGEEYSVDCLTDKNGELIFISPRSRDRTMAGISVGGQTEELTDEIKQIANALNDKLSFTGLWFFQIKKDSNGKWKLMEFAARCASTMGLTRARGVNLPLLSVYIALGLEVTVEPNDYKVKMDRSLISRYKISYEYDTVYFDFDDTLIINGKVHAYSIMFLYQCLYQGKKVILITRHADDIHESLKKYAIDEKLFDSIVHIKDVGEKITSIAPDKALFIDNAFSERKMVQDRFHIPVFDVDAIEALLDWRS
jgi:phosphoribosylamine-glycine ligase